MIVFTRGDTAVVTLTANNGQGQPVNITGASFVTQIKGPNGVIASFPNNQHAITDAANGVFTLSLGSTDTEACGLGNNKEILTQITIGSQITYFRGTGILQVLPPVPNQ